MAVACGCGSEALKPYLGRVWLRPSARVSLFEVHCSPSKVATVSSHLISVFEVLIGSLLQSGSNTWININTD